jgi:prepilin-type N-terminal cleavage/methylation domain-containing protein
MRSASTIDATRGFRSGARPPANEAGFTLVEMMVSLAILAMVMTGVAGAFYGALRTASASPVFRTGEVLLGLFGPYLDTGSRLAELRCIAGR